MFTKLYCATMDNTPTSTTWNLCQKVTQKPLYNNPYTWKGMIITFSLNQKNSHIIKFFKNKCIKNSKMNTTCLSPQAVSKKCQPFVIIALLCKNI